MNRDKPDALMGVDARQSASGRTQWDWSSANGIDTLVSGMHTSDQSDYLG